MGGFTRSINVAIDKITGEEIHAAKYFENTAESFKKRVLYHENKIAFICRECEQDLVIAKSKKNRLYFRHSPNHNYCLLSDESLSKEDHKKNRSIIEAKESPRHKELKNMIGTLLSQIVGVEKHSISIDNRFIIRKNEKRRPDVYCKFKGFEIVFEIQLSDLSLSYILSRHHFYKNNGIFLIWILDQYNIQEQGSKELDIKYLAKHQNFFKLNEDSEEFRLICQYKVPYITWENEVQSKWQMRSVSLDELNYETEDYQAYFFNYQGSLAIITKQQKRKEIEIAENIKKEEEYQKKRNAEIKVASVTKKIQELRKRKSFNFQFVAEEIQSMKDHEIDELNRSLDLNNRVKFPEPPLLQWIRKADHHDYPFLQFIIACEKIEINVNEKTSDGKSAFQEVYTNNAIDSLGIIKSLLKRGYYITDNDIDYVNGLQSLSNERRKNTKFLQICNRLSDRDLIDIAYKYRELLFILESAQKGFIIGYNRPEDDFIWFANNAIQHHSALWVYIEKAFKIFGLWEIVIEKDNKDSFKKKLKEMKEKAIEQDKECEPLVFDLYPELIAK